MKTKIVCLGMLLLLGCSSTKLVSTWKNPDIVLFEAYKVLVVGMTQDDNLRTEFETRLADRLNAKGVEAMRSIDLFDVEFTSSEKSEEELSEVEGQLLDKGFDAILFTKVVGTENRRTFRERMSNLNEMYTRFSTDYLDHQDIYYNPEYYETFNIYTVETSLYCICIDKERELIWRSDIDVLEPINMEKTVESYIKLIASKMGEQDVIF
ncbi:hypothetical protein DKG77_00590 [Flagellimonas aquimarina]|jgi:hypothetical protein|uniref:Cardiolipin synthetase n=1 Tax=Flagellimonas aquimarina TaxID=2201895 RepID=A0A316L374_9FLAO|nr:hypothetical protein [Allomuricauda koreensis]PWL39369.1 hypothetical protein DKG77_00590 [Allomuricauda koreensis]